MRFTWLFSLRYGEPTTATKAHGTHKMLSVGKIPTPLSASLKSPMGSGSKGEADCNTIFCSCWAGMFPSSNVCHFQWGAKRTEEGFSLLYTQEAVLPSILLPSQSKKKCMCVHTTHTYTRVYWNWTVNIYVTYVKHNMYCAFLSKVRPVVNLLFFNRQQGVLKPNKMMAHQDPAHPFSIGILLTELFPTTLRRALYGMHELCSVHIQGQVRIIWSLRIQNGTSHVSVLQPPCVLSSPQSLGPGEWWAAFSCSEGRRNRH